MCDAWAKHGIDQNSSPSSREAHARMAEPRERRSSNPRRIASAIAQVLLTGCLNRYHDTVPVPDLRGGERSVAQRCAGMSRFAQLPRSADVADLPTEVSGAAMSRRGLRPGESPEEELR